ncbi:DNA polymerase subunit gamma-2, mitochondrial isoform X2 [Aethina tumida]|uniref:DNA polymerase subunit gamma-2, mitochondrial isoform X2 n=1 Tax=Aethina tumida TaxID=116153 RepID=UPI0021488053|nr:DNA polymerase subunit gamma-2, mitochondrial isoform X2 [Aethina tumida]
MSFNKIIEMCIKHGFFKQLNNVHYGCDQFSIQPTAALLLENLRKEWTKSIVINKDVTVVLSGEIYEDSLEFVSSLCSEKLPFGVAEIKLEEKNTNKKFRNLTDFANEPNFKKHFVMMDNYGMTSNFYVSPKDSTQFFHNFQRQRRMWWRKFSADPGRYSFSDLRNADECQSVDILSKYNWGKQVLETLTLKKMSNKSIQDGRNTVVPDCIISKANLIEMMVNTVCDAYDEPKFQGKPRPMLHFHRKLAPYKISFAIDSAKAAGVAELKDLALYLCRQLRDNHVSTLYIPSSYRQKISSLYQQFDQMGVPYNVVLTDSTLKDGIAFLRSRDTTLKEQVHVSDIVKYVEKLFKNY